MYFHILSLIYHYNSNSNPFRNLATVEFLEKGLGIKDAQIREEHILAYSNFVKEFVTSISKGPKEWKEFKEWAKENYYQEAISEEQRLILDQKTIAIDRFTGRALPPYSPKSGLHILQEKLGMQNVDINIRKYNDYFTANPNGGKETISLRKSGRWQVVGSPDKYGGYYVGKRSYSYNPHF